MFVMGFRGEIKMLLFQSNINSYVTSENFLDPSIFDDSATCMNSQDLFRWSFSYSLLIDNKKEWL